MNVRPALIVASFLLVAASPRVKDHRSVLIDNVQLDITAWAADDDILAQSFEAAFVEAERISRLINPADPTSQVGRVNATPVGRPANLSSDLMRLVERTLFYQAATEGRFDPTKTGLAQLDIDVRRARVTRITSDSGFDFSCVRAGLLLDAAAEKLRAGGAAAARLTFGGQLLAVGTQEAQSVEIREPEKGRAIAKFDFDRGSVVSANAQGRTVTIVASSAEEAAVLGAALVHRKAEDGDYVVTENFPRAAALFVEKIRIGWRLTPTKRFPTSALTILHEDAQLALKR